ncbi:amidohydrolase family protein [Pseudomaricurvus alkylphenolicus]|uniref:metal-dependent hydrolase family protein n=1 Tax=Pseudomaricurvus alkylphenolicus TaxID=1306991 RepID=UPI00141DF6AB|nr:amidohydrolase family protein [Pseudomaricurvus alkylphenolicus]NIB38262.1 amidohydrolase family protein [Pseudomaricurvus alkylphenolicus]
MSQPKIFKNAVIFDGVNEELIEGGSVVVEGERIREVTDKNVNIDNAEVLDLKGKFLMPGLLDLHFHAYSISFNMAKLDSMPKPLKVSHSIKLLEGALQRGFTTVRDPGGGDVGLRLATEAGLINGPRFLYGGQALSQTGGHGDMRRHDEEEMSCGCAYSGTICQVVDGVDDVRKLVREELRKGADHIKMFISGGVASPTDPIWMPQFTDEEIRAAVYECETRRKYVVVHCHTDVGAKRSIANGVRSIDHATEILPDTAEMLAATDKTFAVPTLAVMRQILDYGPELGMYPESLEKIKPLWDQVLTSVENMHRAGAKMGMGTDLFGPQYHPLQSKEFEYRAEVQPAIDVLRSATSINAEIVQMKGAVGEISAGAYADMIVLDGNPLKDLSVFQRPEQMPLIMKGGSLIRNELH